MATTRAILVSSIFGPMSWAIITTRRTHSPRPARIGWASTVSGPPTTSITRTTRAITTRTALRRYWSTDTSRTSRPSWRLTGSSIILGRVSRSPCSCRSVRRTTRETRRMCRRSIMRCSLTRGRPRALRCPRTTSLRTIPTRMRGEGSRTRRSARTSRR